MRWRRISIILEPRLSILDHIDQDEQLRRFQARQENPKKQWKLHEEDWRNREKWKPYEEAVGGDVPSHAHKVCPVDNYRR